MAWIVLLIAGLFEIGWAVGLKYTDGFTRLWPTVGTAAALVASMGLLGVALRTLPLGTAYAVWTGIGTIGTAVLGIVLLGESAGAARLAWRAEDLHPSGACGNAADADAERGRALVEHAAKALVELLQEIDRFPLETLRAR